MDVTIYGGKFEVERVNCRDGYTVLVNDEGRMTLWVTLEIAKALKPLVKT